MRSSSDHLNRLLKTKRRLGLTGSGLRGRSQQERAAERLRQARPQSWRYLQPAELKRLRNLEFVARRIVEGYFSGKHRSPFRDFSQEFADYRAYVPGDDLRTLDWKAYARTDRYYIKRFRKDTGMPCVLMLDKSNSMSYEGAGEEGGLSKLEYACFLVAALAFLIVKHGDRAGLCTFDYQVRDYHAPAGTMSHLFALLNTLEHLRPGAPTSTAESLRTAYHLIRRRSLLIVVSDFLEDPDEIFSALSMFTHKQFEIVLFHVLHDDELDLPDLEYARFVDLEAAGTLVTEPRTIRTLYREELERHVQQMRAHAQAQHLDYNLVLTSTPYVEVLERYLATRHALRATRFLR